MIIPIDKEYCFRETVEALKKGKVLILPTDTIYGFSGIVPETESKILKIKNRSAEKKMIRLLAKPEDIFQYTDQSISDAFFYKWPSALTLIVRSKDGTGTTAFRCPGYQWLREVIEAVGQPIFSSSVNLSGSSNLQTVREIADTFGRKVSFIVDAGELAGAASTVVDLTLDEPMILRRGSVEI